MYLPKQLYLGFERSLLIKHYFYFGCRACSRASFIGFDFTDPSIYEIHQNQKLFHEIHQNQKLFHGKLIQVNPRLSVTKRKCSSLLLNPPNNKDKNKNRNSKLEKAISKPKNKSEAVTNCTKVIRLLPLLKPIMFPLNQNI